MTHMVRAVSCRQHDPQAPGYASLPARSRDWKTYLRRAARLGPDAPQSQVIITRRRQGDLGDA